MHPKLVAYVETQLTRINKSSLSHQEKAQEFVSVVANVNKVKELGGSDLRKEYRKFFMTLLKKYGVASPAELTDKQTEKFFTEVENKWVEGRGIRQ